MLSCCCGTSPCDIATDNFNRANETPVAAPWSKLSGTDANLSSNVLDFPAAAFYKHTTAYPGAATESRNASTRVKFSTAGGVELAVGLTDASNYFAASLTYSASGCSVLSATMVTAGVGAFGGGCAPTVSVTTCVNVPGLATGDWSTLEVCLIPGAYPITDKVIAKVTLANGEIYSCTAEANGPAVGAYAGVRSTVAAQFDDFKHRYYRDSPSGEHRTCPNCNTPCLIGSDDFTTDVPCKWQVIGGSYTVSSGVFNVTANNTQVTFAQFHPGLKTSQIVTVKVKDTASVARVYIGNGYAQLTIAGGSHTLSLRNNAAAEIDSDVDAISADATKWLDLTLCYSRGVLSATVTGHDGIDLCADAVIAETASGYWTSIGGNNGAVLDDFVFKKSYDTHSPSDGGCDGCTACPTECSDCCDFPNPAGSYIVDLGAGGWTSRACNATAPYLEHCDLCANVEGEFLVVATAECTWYCLIEGDCPMGPISGGGVGCCTACSTDWTGSIVLALVKDGTGCRWRVVVTIAPPVVDPMGCGCVYDGVTAGTDAVSALYYSDYLTGTDKCDTMPVTLTKAIGGDSGNFPCAGTLPATITLESAT